MMKPIIEFKNVYKSFGGHRVLNGVDIAIYHGETITILGGSGTGKSVFLKLLLGIIHPDKGQIFFKGKIIENMTEEDIVDMRSHIGMLFQNAALFDSLTVAENIAYPLQQHFQLHEDEILKKVSHKLELVGLPGVENLMPAELSGGMKKRVGLARAIATNPDIVLYDEPTTGLDPANTKRINHLIKELQRKLEVTSIVVTHDLESASYVSDRLALIHEGKFGFIGTVEEAKNSNDEVVNRFMCGEMDTGDIYEPTES